MKKLFLALVLCTLSTAAFCGGPTCRVYGANDIVATLTRIGAVEGDPEYIEITVQLTENPTENISVVVEATQDGNFVGSTVVTFSSFMSMCEGKIFLNSSYNENGGPVAVNIASASCQ